MADNSLTPKEEFLLNPVTEHNITDAAIATFETNLRHPVKVEIPLEPVQEGTGDPSPDNVRPISGWTGCLIGKNDGNDLNSQDVSWQSGYILNPTGSTSVNNPYGYTKSFQNIEGTEYILVTFSGLVSNSCYIIFYDAEENWISGETVWSFASPPTEATWRKPIYVPNGAVYVRWSCITAQKDRIHFAKSSGISINWQTEAGTVYGGTVTLNEDGSADVVATKHGIIYDGSEDEGWAGTSSTFYVPAPPDCKKTQIPIGNWLKGVQNISYITLPNLSFAMTTSPHNYVNFKYNSVSSLDAFKQLLEATPFMAVYDLVTPITYHFPNVGQLKAFLGTNNVWSDIGNVNVKYLTQNSETGMEYRGDRALELRRRAMLADAPTIHTTVGSSDTGGLASFKSYVKALVKSITIPFEPVQDLHGMPNPYPAGASVNLISDGTDTSNGYVVGRFLRSDNSTESETNWYVSEYFPIDPSVTYTLSTRASAQYPGICFYDENKTFISGIAANGVLAQTFTPPAGAAYMRASQTIEAYQNDNPSGVAFQIEVGSTATEYRRYSNICPIEGRTECKITKSNTSIKEHIFSEIQEGSGSPSATNYRPIIPGLSIVRDDNSELNVYGGRLKVNADGTSILTATRGKITWNSSMSPSKLNNAYPRTAIVWGASTYLWGGFDHKCDRADWSKSYGIGGFIRAGTSWVLGSPTQAIYDIEDDAEWLAAMKAWLDEHPITICSNLNYPVIYNLTATETARALDALGITQQILPITFTDPDSGDPMTVYSGTVTLNEDGSADVISRGKLFALNKYNATYKRVYSDIVDFAFLDPTHGGIEVNGDYTRIRFAVNDNAPSGYNYQSKNSSLPISNLASHIYGGRANRPYWYIDANKSLYINLPTTIVGTTLQTAAEYFHNAITTNKDILEIFIPYNTPKVYHLTAAQLKTFLGENHFWCDISDDITVKYWNRGFGN